MNDRTCIVTKKSGSPDELIRFVADPDGQIVPDIKANLPGRGAWVQASYKSVEDAIKRKAFSRSLKKEVIVSQDLAELVDSLLMKAALGHLAMARKAGAVITGASKVDKAIRSGDVRLILHAIEAAEDGKRKIAQAIFSAYQNDKKTVTALSLFTMDEMGVAFGDNHVVHAALMNMKAANGFIKMAKKLVAYRGIEDSEPKEMTVDAVKETE
ncbi:RNA-binding protein [Bartonella tamiae]|uniref:YlxR domain-containing protein n=1 Tax=Bartonella tamiae Th239 TaxID=1094558 RepID=J1K2C3_9HYPH|nr:RNA-binding protein [Bartonella tamiae]EJF91260.1 hypothetical protein ME5_00592 [Bartonella tamiae Th239]EJF93075.1 hypothetical protein MEG_01289 [Bartonella tamiae Th307]